MPQTTNGQHAGELHDPRPRKAGGGVVPVLAFAGITVAVMQTLLVPVIKDLPALLHTDPSNATWVMTATLLAGAVSTPIMGRLGDLYGKRKMLLASLAVMVIGSLICAFTDDLVVMIGGARSRASPWAPSRWASASCVTSCRARSSARRWR